MDDKKKLLAEADEAYGELQKAVADVDERQASAVWLGTWGVREILVHITGWEREMVPAFARIGRGEAAYPAGTYDDFDAWNARFVEERKGVKLADVLVELETTHRDFIRAADALPAAAFATGGAARDLFEGTGPQHYREHAGQIREWHARA